MTNVLYYTPTQAGGDAFIFDHPAQFPITLSSSSTLCSNSSTSAAPRIAPRQSCLTRIFVLFCNSLRDVVGWQQCNTLFLTSFTQSPAIVLACDLQRQWHGSKKQCAVHLTMLIRHSILPVSNDPSTLAHGLLPAENGASLSPPPQPLHMRIQSKTLLAAGLVLANAAIPANTQTLPSGFVDDMEDPIADPAIPQSSTSSPAASADPAMTPSTGAPAAPSSSADSPPPRQARRLDPATSSSSGSSSDVAGEVEDLVSYAGEDPNFILPNQPVESVIGFSKTPLETPRSISVISSELISSLALQDVQDLTRIAPNTFTTTRWGVQGNIDIRNMTADTYFRGMKRIEPQGNSRTVLGANDQIEIVRGAPAPYLGPGKIGGYSNMTPKAGRSRQGQYLDSETGFIQGIIGDFGRREVSFGYGGPMNLVKDLKGGYYVYGMLDDSDTFYQHIESNQKILQAAITQDINDTWRVEAGFNLAQTLTAGGFLNRVDQDLVDNGMYWTGTPLINLDTDGSGKISQAEMELNSPTLNRGLSAANRPLHQRWDGRFQAVLNGTSPNVDIANPPAGTALAAIMQTELAPHINQQTANLLALLPQGFVMDPATMRHVKADYTAVALEKALRADLGVFYLDLMNDKNPFLKMKNQLFFDTQDQFKDSELPFYQKQDVYVIEEKFTLEKTFEELPDGLDLAVIASPNIRHTWAQIRSNTGDYDDRPDLGLPGNVRTPYDTFITPRENDDYFNGGAFFNDNRRSTYTEFGVGTLVDATFWEKANLLTGVRMDYIDGKTTDYAGVYSVTSGTIDNPLGRRRNEDLVARGNDFGISHTSSFSYQLPYNIRPYVTYSEQSTLMDGSSITITRPTMVAGAYEKATLKEAGIKGSFFKDKLFATLSFYSQQRSSFTDDVGGAVVTSTDGEGIEMELRWVPSKNFYASLFGVVQKTVLLPGNGQWARIHGETLGFEDIVDGNGNVIYPAEAFTWGGRAEYFIEDGQSIEHPGYPNTQFGFNTAYTLPWNLSIGGGATYAAAVQSGRFQNVILPESLIVDVNISYNYKGWRLRADIFNLTDALYFRGRNGTFAGDVLISAMQPRRFQFTASKTF